MPTDLPQKPQDTAPATDKKKRPVLRAASEAVGLSVVTKVGGIWARDLRDSAYRSRDIFSILRARPSSAREVMDPTVDGERKFIEAARLNNLGEIGLNRAISATHRQFVLYAVLTFVALVVGITSIRWAPVPAGFVGISVIARFATVPIGLALMLRAGYANWIMRRRSIDGLGVYLRSNDIMTKPGT